MMKIDQAGYAGFCAVRSRFITLVLILVLLIGFPRVSVSDIDNESRETKSVPIQYNEKFRHFESKELAEIGQIWSLADDHQGYMWFGGERGAVRFDGLNYKLYRHNSKQAFGLPPGTISDILPVNDRLIWFATHHGLYQYLPHQQKFIQQPVALGVNVIWDLFPDPKDNSLWIAHFGNEIIRYYPDSHKIERYSADKVSDDRERISEQFFSVYRDSKGMVWAGSNVGLYRLDVATKKVHSFTASNTDGQYVHGGAVLSIQEDSKGNLWIGTVNGLYRYQFKDDRFQRYFHEKDNEHSIGGDSVGDILLDQHDRVWMLLDGGGIAIYDDEQDNFVQYLAQDSRRGALKNNFVRRGHISSRKDIWLAFHPHGVAVKNKYSPYFDTFEYRAGDPHSLSSSNIHSVEEGDNGTLWVGTDNGINQLDLRSGKVERLRSQSESLRLFESNAILCLLYDRSGVLWAGSWGGGLISYNPQTGAFLQHKGNPEVSRLPGGAVFSLAEIDDEHLLISSEEGVSIFNKVSGVFSIAPNFDLGVEKMVVIDEHTTLVKSYHSIHLFDNRTRSFIPNKHFQKINAKLHDAFVDEDKTIWLLTDQGVRLQKHRDEDFTDMKTNVNFKDSFYGQIIKADNNSLWFGGVSGVSAYNIKTGYFSEFDESYGLPTGSFTVSRAALKLSDGRMIFGSTNGLLLFDSNLLHVESTKNKLIFTGLKVLSKAAEFGDANSPMDKPIEYASRIKLDYFENFISLDYSALQFQAPLQKNYFVRLKGLEDGWRNVGDMRQATFTNLNPGSYTFEVMTLNQNTGGIDQKATFDIEITPPWWRTGKAYTVYVLIIFGIMALVCYSIWSYFLREKERRINLKLRTLDKTKDDFLAFTSHELRTPLNGIIGLLESIVYSSDSQANPNLNGPEPIDGPEPSPQDETLRKIKLAISAGRRLNFIVNDILDFLKFKEHKVDLKFDTVNLIELVDELFYLFRPMIVGKEVELRNQIPNTFPNIIADKQRLTQILYNLIGNALKFTEYGTVSVIAREAQNAYFVSVSDSGCGISPEDIKAIFEPYKQALNQDHARTNGTGIGLSVSKNLVELHGGEILVESELGGGTVFQFSLKKQSSQSVKVDKNDEDNGLSNIDGNDNTDKKAKEDVLFYADQHPDKPLRFVLIEDDPVNRMVVRSIIERNSTTIIEFEKGSSAIEEVITQKPDIVILDIYLPDTTGFEVAKSIRKQYTAEELPILFLTGNLDQSSVKESYDSGANGVIFKPVSRSDLIESINECLNNAPKSRWKQSSE